MAGLDQTEAPPGLTAEAQHRAIRDKNPFAACGRTVSYLMNVPNLARLPFGQLSKLIVGQINRGHYFFVVDRSSAICGYCGWTQAGHEEAEGWLERNVEVSGGNLADGPVCVINIWQASSPKANAIIIGALRTMIHPATELVVAKRFYSNGTIRPVRIPISPQQLRQRQKDGGA
jgi:hemolysin-activating ACP:hemolysin acyltransferase